MQAECRVLLENSTLRYNTAINGGAFFAASTPCFMVSFYIRLFCKLLMWVGGGMLERGWQSGLVSMQIARMVSVQQCTVILSC